MVTDLGFDSAGAVASAISTSAMTQRSNYTDGCSRLEEGAGMIKAQGLMGAGCGDDEDGVLDRSDRSIPP